MLLAASVPPGLENLMTLATALLIALILDALFGEPKWLWSRFPHPAVLMGNAISYLDRRFNRGYGRRLRGAMAFANLALGAILLGLLLSLIPTRIIDILLCAILLAQASLVQHVRAVADALRLSTGDGRRAVAMIVGRDTRDMDAPAISRGAIESAAENFSDGVIAPAFWFLIGGLPGLLLYKATNTADSMIGYKTERHLEFGWAAARFDDLLNWIPARLTALLIWLAAGMQGTYRAIRNDAALHRSPNAGWPESTMARALNVALSGPRAYHGRTRAYPFVNETGQHDIGPDQIDQSCKMLWRAWGLFLGLTALIALVT